MTDTVDKIIIQSEARGVQQTTSEVQGLSKAMDGVTVASEKTERSSVSLEGKFAQLERRFGTTAGQATQLAKIQKTVSDAVAQDASLRERGNAIIDAASARLAKASNDNQQLARTTGLARHELINLSRQFQDIGVSLASGQSPLTVAIQQGSQVADVFASSTGSVKGFVEQVGSGVARLLTPVRVLAGGILSVGAAAAYIGSNWAESERQISLALTGIGRRSGETIQSINKFSQDNASATGLSVAEARNVAIEFAKTGNLTASTLKGVGDAVRGYSILTGKDATEATKDLAGALSGDLLAAALKMDATYGVMNAATLENIRTLEAQGQRAEAVQIILDKMAPVNLKAAESVGILSKAWSGLTNVFSNAVNGAPPVGQGPQDRLNNLLQRRDEFPGSNIGRNERGELQQFKDAADKAAYFKQKIDEAQAALNSFNAEQAAAQLEKLSGEAFKIGQAVLPQVDAIAKLDAAIRKMQEAQAAGVGPSNSSGIIAALEQQRSIQQESLESTVRQAEYVKQLQSAWGGVSTQTAVTLNHLEGQLGVASAVTGQARIAAQERATYNDLLAQGVKSEEASAIAAKEADVARASATANVQRQTSALADQNEMIKASLNGTEATTAAAIAYKNAIEAGADATAAAALKAEVLYNYMLKARQAAEQAYQSMDQQNYSNYVRASGAPGMVAGGDTGGYREAQPSRGGSFSGLLPGVVQYRGGATSMRGSSNAGGRINVPFNGRLINTLYGPQVLQNANPSFNPSDMYQRIANDASAGGLAAALAAVQARSLSNPEGFSAQLSTVEQLVQAMNANAGRPEQLRNLENELAWLRSTPQSLQRDIAIINLQKSIEDLRNSTDALNDTMKVTLNPLYNGRDALRVGYMHAAKGLDVIAQGPTTGDQVPFRAMVNGGERITITPAGQSPSNDNSKTITVNNTINIGATRSTSRRSARQAAQGFGQMMASLS